MVFHAGERVQATASSADQLVQHLEMVASVVFLNRVFNQPFSRFSDGLFGFPGRTASDSQVSLFPLQQRVQRRNETSRNRDRRASALYRLGCKSGWNTLAVGICSVCCKILSVFCEKQIPPAAVFASLHRTCCAGNPVRRSISLQRHRASGAFNQCIGDLSLTREERRSSTTAGHRGHGLHQALGFPIIARAFGAPWHCV